MAWRIDRSVVRGEIDNRTRGRVTGRIWFVGRDAPVELELAGNAWRDLAGRRLEFVNRAPKAGSIEGIAQRQTGVIGDCTASRKVKVPEIPMEQIGEYYAARRPWPWHWGNSLYLEWYSEFNGRVVIESVDFDLTIGPEIAWEMSETEEEGQRRANAEAMTEFMQRGLEALASEAGEHADKPEEESEWPNAKPLTEAEAEKMQEESDRLSDRIQARIDREGPNADFARILDEELQRRARERGEEPLSSEEESERAEWIEEVNRAAEEALANPDPELEAELKIRHPLAEQAFALTTRLMKEPEERGWIPQDAMAEHPVVDLINGVMSASAKLAGALNGQTWPPEVDFCANHIVRLKRARGYVDDALLAAEVCAEQRLVDADWLTAVQAEIAAIGRDCDALISELRARLERGFD